MTTTLIINGSPKIKNSASSILIDMLLNKINEQTDIISINFNNFKTNLSNILFKYKKIIIVSPLYADGLPSHLLEALTINEKNIKKDTQIYGIVNCGLIEGIHAKQGLDIIKNFAIKCKSKYLGGLGIGGCGGLYEMYKRNILKLFSRNIKKKINQLAESIHNSECINNLYTKIGFTRILYKLIGNFDWKKRIKSFS